MFATAYDRGEAVCVSVLRGGGDDARDVDELLAAVRKLDAECATHPRGTAYVLHVLGDIPIPDARARQAFAQTAAALRARRHCFVLVSSSGLVRGVLRAVTWIAPPPKGHHVLFAEDLDTAVAEAERALAAPLPMLRPLHARALASLERPSRLP